MIPYGRQDVTTDDIKAVVEVLQSDFLTQGPVVPRFEKELASTCGAAHAVAVNSATSALHVACMALGLGPGDVLWTVPNTFVASANCGMYCGAVVDFVDIHNATWNIDLGKFEAKLAIASTSGELPKVVVPVHFAGQPTEQKAIWSLAQRYGFRVVEDASHSIGSSSDGNPTGNCAYSDITVFSFHPVKIVTTGEGGAALTNSDELAARMRQLRTHGITKDPTEFSAAAPPPWHYEQHVLGMNYRLTEIQAALGLSQLRRLKDYVLRRNELAGRYGYLLHDLPLQLPMVRPGVRSAFHLYVVRLVGQQRARHREVFRDLQQSGIGVNLHYTPVHLQPYYRSLGFRPGDFPESELHGRSAITLPLYPTMTEASQDRVVHVLRDVLA